jgi:hypothetical protein
VTAPKPRATPGRPAWPELRALAGAARDRAEDGLGDWDPGDVSDAITAVETAGWPFKRALAGGLRAAVLADARGSSGPGLTREEREELRSLALANCEAATEQWKHPGRVTGGQPVLAEGNDNRQEAS